MSPIHWNGAYHHDLDATDVRRTPSPPRSDPQNSHDFRPRATAGYTDDQIAATVVVAIVNAYLADHPDVFASPDRQRDLLDILDAFVRAGWTEARALVFRISDIWR